MSPIFRPVAFRVFNLLCLWLLGASLGAAASVSNPGFETGNLNGWIPYPVPATISAQASPTAKEGSYLARIQFNGLNTLIQDIPSPHLDYTPGSYFTLSAWYQFTSDTPSAYPAMTAHYMDIAGNLHGNYNTVSGNVGNTTTWTRFEITFQGQTDDYLRISLRNSGSGQGVALYDDVQILPAADAPENLDIYLLMGQSNMVGVPTDFIAVDTPIIPNIYMLNPSDAWIAAKEPVHGVGVGPGFAFARAMMAAHPDRRIGLVPLAVGQTPISVWVKGGANYNIMLAKAAIAEQAGTIRGILWHQGENDSYDENLANIYQTQFTGMIADLRADLGKPVLPIVCGELGRFFGAGFKGTVNTAQETVAAADSHMRFVSSENLTNMDPFHFDAPSQRVFGARYAAGMLAIQDQVTSTTHWNVYQDGK